MAHRYTFRKLTSMKYALGIEYCGRHYFGWQKQRLPNTIQESVENALSSVADESIALTCAGRTDAGVHALQQVVHFETTAERESHAWVLGSNTLLPDDIAITWAKVIDDEFHARFSALSRTYQYLILNRRARPALFNGLVTWECRALDLARMKAASQALIGQHDFSSYRAVACQARSPERTVHRLDIQRLGEWYVISICANAFFYYIVILR